nr:sensor histidine kinase [uncultured Carboxylicivirga sp.]
MLESKNKYLSLVIHALVWMALFGTNYGFFSTIIDPVQAFTRTALMLSIHFILFYTFWFLLVPEFYVAKRYKQFWIYTSIVILLCAFIRLQIKMQFDVNTGLIGPRLADRFEARGFLVSIGASSLIAGIASLIRISRFYTRKTREHEKLTQEKTEAELQLLKAQINPHFLFNSLNNIYALVLTKNEKAPESLMSLSQLLRYIIYETSAFKVSLEKEITYLQFYIELESLRLVNPNSLHVDIQQVETNLQIMPMLFIPFVENAFKHSNINQGGGISVKLHLHQDNLTFICSNTIGSIHKTIDKVGGVGLENTKRRLEMLYAGNYKLSITQKELTYTVKLTITL